MDELTQKIATHDAGVIELLAGLDDLCGVDQQGRTLFDVAIENNNSEVMAWLAGHKLALGFAAPIDEGLKPAIRHHIDGIGVGYPLADLEAILAGIHGDRLAYGRTPLLAACRAGNAEAMALLLKAGATPGDKDLLGLTAPELCLFSHGETGLMDFLRAFRASGQKKLAVAPKLLREVFSWPELLPTLLEVCSLSVPAKRLLFVYDCARLDRAAVLRQLDEGLDLNKTITNSQNPLVEVCMARLFWEGDLPDSDRLAYHMKKYMGPAGSHSVSFDNRLLKEDGSNFGRLMAEAEHKRKALIAYGQSLTLSEEQTKEMVESRCAVIDILLAAGLDLQLALEKCDIDLFADLETTHQHELAKFLKLRLLGITGGQPTAETAEPKISGHWELSGEAVLLAEWFVESDSSLIRLRLNNPYGRLDNVRIALRLADGEAERASAVVWTPVPCVQERLEVDGEWRNLLGTDEGEDVYGEALWEAVYEVNLAFGDHLPAQIEFRLEGPLPGGEEVLLPLASTPMDC